MKGLRAIGTRALCDVQVYAVAYYAYDTVQDSSHLLSAAFSPRANIRPTALRSGVGAGRLNCSMASTVIDMDGGPRPKDVKVAVKLVSHEISRPLVFL